MKKLFPILCLLSLLFCLFLLPAGAQTEQASLGNETGSFAQMQEKARANGGTLKLLTDVTTDGTGFDGTYTLDLAGKTLTLTASAVIPEGSTLTVTDSASGGRILCTTSSVFTLTGGNLKVTGGKLTPANTCVTIQNVGKGIVSLAGAPILESYGAHIYMGYPETLCAQADGVSYTGTKISVSVGFAVSKGTVLTRGFTADNLDVRNLSENGYQVEFRDGAALAAKMPRSFLPLIIVVAVLVAVALLVVTLISVRKVKDRKAMAELEEEKAREAARKAKEQEAENAGKESAKAEDKTPEAPLSEAPAEEPSVAEELPAREETPAPETPAAEEMPAAEPVAEEKTAEPAELPADALDETPITEEAPVAEEATMVEETPVVEEAPVVEETPVIEETPAVEEAPEIVEVSAAEESASAEEIPVPEVTPESEKETEKTAAENHEPQTDVYGNVVFSTYKKSFAARMSEATDEVKERYCAVKNALLSYQRVNARISWNYESFKSGRTQLAKFALRGKTLCLYLALDPKDPALAKYFVNDVSDERKFSTVPCRLRLTSKRSAKWAAELVDILAREKELSPNPKYKKQDFDFPALSTEEMLKEGLIRKVGAD